jgi:hypothetical protein
MGITEKVKVGKFLKSLDAGVATGRKLPEATHSVDLIVGYKGDYEQSG